MGEVDMEILDGVSPFGNDGIMSGYKRMLIFNY
jgi:hypothetical protein